MTRCITHWLEYPLEIEHELRWILIKNGFKKHPEFQGIFYNNYGDIFYIRQNNLIKNRYEIKVYSIENDIKYEKGSTSHYEELEKLIKDLGNSGKPNNS